MIMTRISFHTILYEIRPHQEVKKIKYDSLRAQTFCGLASGVIMVKWKVLIGILSSHCLDSRRIAFADASFKWALSTKL